MLDIAVIGAGGIGREHVARLGRHDRSRVSAIVDPSPVAREWAAAAGVPHFPSTEEMLAAAKPAGAIVATPNETHVELALPLIERRVPVLVEKPLADSVEQGLRLVRAARANATPVLVGHHRRHSTAIQAAQRHIREGKLGRLVAVTSSTLFYKPDDYFSVGWRRGPAGGPILINLVHDIDSLRALAGDIAAVTAVVSNAVRGFEVEDTAAVIVEFRSGALGTLMLSDTAVAVRSWEQTSGENLSYPRDVSQDCIFLAGTLGSLAVPTLMSWRQDPPPSWKTRVYREKLDCSGGDPLVRQIDHFCDVIEGRAEPLVSAEEGLATLAATLAVRESARTGKRVELSAGWDRESAP